MNKNNVQNHVTENTSTENNFFEQNNSNESTTSSWDDPNIAILTGNYKYKITGLIQSRPIQNFYVGSTYIYITQQDNTGTYYISRCNLNGQFMDFMTIEDGGHGSTLELSHKDGSNVYFLIATHTNIVNGTIYSNQLGIIKYEAGKTIKNIDIKRIKGIKYANSKAEGFCDEINSAIGALTQNKNKILIYARASGKVQYSLYDYATFKNSLTTTPATFQNNTTLKNACNFSCVQEGASIVLPNGQFQGIDISNLKNNIYSIYIASGNENIDNKPLIVSKMDYNISTKTLVHKQSAYINLNPITFTEKYEMEGIHIISDSEIYIGIVGSNKRQAYIFSIKTSYFN